MSIKKHSLGFLLLVCLFTAMPAAAQTPTRAVVADSYADALHVFDWESNSLLGTVNIPENPEVSPLSIENCLITSDGTTAYVPDNFYRIWVVDLTTDPPELAIDGINPIIGSSVAEDITLTPDENYLLVAGRSTIGNYPPQVTPISCVDLATQTEVSTLMLPDGLPGVIEVCDDGTTVLASVPGSNGFVAKLTLDADGHGPAQHDDVRRGNHHAHPRQQICAHRIRSRHRLWFPHYRCGRPVDCRYPRVARDVVGGSGRFTGRRSALHPQSRHSVRV